MNKWFDLDSPIMQALSRMADMVLLSMLWFVCCLPVITIGPSTTAMYYVALKMARGESVKIGATFFQAFKSNFKQAAIMNVISLAIGAVLVVDGYYWFFAQGSMATISFAIFFVMLIWLLCIMFYAYPLQAQFFNTVKQTFINAAILSMRKFPITVIIFFLNLLPLWVAFLSLEVVIRTMPIWVLLTPGIVAVINAKFFAKMFDPFLKAAKGEQSEKEKTEE